MTTAAWPRDWPRSWPDLAFDSLKAPIKRVAIPHVPVPFAVPMEDYVTPTAERIEAAVRSVMG